MGQAFLFDPLVPRQRVCDGQAERLGRRQEMTRSNVLDCSIGTSLALAPRPRRLRGVGGPWVVRPVVTDELPRDFPFTSRGPRFRGNMVLEPQGCAAIPAATSSSRPISITLTVRR